MLSACGAIASLTGARSVQYATYIDGYWGNWEESSCAYQGNTGRFILYNGYSHPSNFYVRLSVYGSASFPTQNDETKSFRGTIEFRNVEDDAKSFVSHIPVSFKSYGEVYSRAAEVHVTKKKEGLLYNVFFNNVGLALYVPWKYAHAMH